MPLVRTFPAGSMLFAMGAVFLACGNSSAPSPFGPDDEVDAGPDVFVPSEAGSDAGEDPSLGGPCLDDGQCDDSIDCTTDRCDQELARCRYAVDDSLCADDVYCDGIELCDLRLGCREGEPVSCSDDDSCTIDTCVEATHSCRYDDRDADGDGDPVWNCEGGGDCNDEDPSVSSNSVEVCNNGSDDDCDEEVDEAGCKTPMYDTCTGALSITADGFYELSLVAAALDYPTLCAPDTPWREVVVALTVPDGPARDVDVVATAEAGQLSLGSAELCTDAANQICALGYQKPDGKPVSRLVFRALSPGVYPLYVAGNADTDVTLKVLFREPEPEPQNETCGTAAELLAGVQQRATLHAIDEDVRSACGGLVGELLYEFTLDEAQDVHLYAAAEDAYGSPVISLRGAACTEASDELTCRVGNPQHLFARALAPGQYFVSLSATGPSDVNLLLALEAPTTAPADEGCQDPPPLEPGVTEFVTLADHIDAVQLECANGAPDASFELALEDASDVLLVALLSDMDTAGLSLAGPACSVEEKLACAVGQNSPLRAAEYGVEPGSYRAVLESMRGSPASITAFTRPAAPAELAIFADDCATALEIPAGGARIQGNTLNAYADFDAGCDVGGQAPGGAPDQLLRLTLDEPRRVVFDMQGSLYQTLLSVRSGLECPGTELSLACAPGYEPERSFLDLELAAGQYYVQIDGYDGDAGPWILDVYMAEL